MIYYLSLSHETKALLIEAERLTLLAGVSPADDARLAERAPALLTSLAAALTSLFDSAKKMLDDAEESLARVRREIGEAEQDAVVAGANAMKIAADAYKLRSELRSALLLPDAALRAAVEKVIGS